MAVCGSSLARILPCKPGHSSASIALANDPDEIFRPDRELCPCSFYREKLGTGLARSQKQRRRGLRKAQHGAVN